MAALGGIREMGLAACTVLLFACAKDVEAPPPGAIIADDVSRIEWSGSELYYSAISRRTGITTVLDVFAAGEDEPLFELDENEVWVGLRDGGFIVSRRDDTSGTSQLFAGLAGNLEALPVPPVRAVALMDRDWLYFFEEGTLMRAPWEGGDSELVATDDELRGDPETAHQVMDAVTSDDAFVYYAENVRYVHRLSKSDHEITLLLDLADVLDFERLPQPYAIANDADHVYLSLNNQNGAESGAIVKIDKATEAAEVLALDAHNPLALALDDDHVYWTRNERNRFAEVGPGAVVRMKKDGSALRVIAERQNGPVLLAVTPEHVYWQNNATRELRRLGLPE
ncbi:MAG TPA: hypothetical protein VF989_07570 [Polyangiaceae bacterium]